MISDLRILAGLAVLLLQSSIALAATFDEITAKGVISVAVYRDFPPFSDRQNGQLAGVDVDLANAIAERMKLKAEFMELTAGESVDDDLRNGVWKGHYLERRVADVMLHIPNDRVFALRNNNAVIFAPYYRERVALARNPDRIYAGDGLDAFTHEKVGVELATLADAYLTGAEGGRLVSNVIHFPTLAQAVEALDKGEISAVMGTESELAGALGPERQKRFPLAPVAMPGMPKPFWDLGLAVKDSNRQLAYAIEDVVQALRKDGTIEAIFRRHHLPYHSPEE